MSKKDKDFPIIIASKTAVCHRGPSEPTRVPSGRSNVRCMVYKADVLLCTPLYCGHFCVLLSVPHEHDFPGDVVPPQASWPWSAAAGGSMCLRVSLPRLTGVLLAARYWLWGQNLHNRHCRSRHMGTSLPLQGQWKGDVGTPRFCLVSWSTPSLAFPECRIFQ